MPVHLPSCIVAGKRSRAAQSSRSVTVAYVQILGPDPHRVSVTFGATDDLSLAPAHATLFVSTRPGITPPNGFPVGVMSGPFTFNIREHGSIVTMAWYGATDQGTVIVSVLETAIDEDLP